ncbi:phosphotransferase [Kitasatospora sp. NPDC101183]|uniref:phosphotransferase n=1 Tax=Kitasatospora sp. NPDC101183 TaxID=3364100 RepID=UPI0038071F22
MLSRPPFGEELRSRLGLPRRARRLTSSPRSRVWQAELSGSTVVIKQLVDAPEADERYAREVAALRLASRADPPVVPRLLGADPVQRVLVLEHLEHGRPREGWIVDYATALARLHATARPTDAEALPRWSGPTPADVDAFLRLADTLGAPAPNGLRAELDALVDRLGRNGARPALLHGDPCPGNDLHTAAGVRFIDFEQSSIGDGAVELAYLRVGFPTCWCVTAPPAGLLAEAEAAYRSTWRSLTGTAAPEDLADACAGWLIRGDALVERARRDSTDHLAVLPHRDWTWGTATARQRLTHRLRTVSRLTAATRTLPHLHHLTTHWPTPWPTLRPLPTHRP